MSKRYLAWDTSSSSGVVVAFEIIENKVRLISEWSLSFETGKHSERLLWTIDIVLKSAGWKLSDLCAIGVGVGPGSFTGIRIGITTAKIVATQLKIPVFPVSSLAVLARGVLQQLGEGKEQDKTLFIACTDATKGEWFTLIGPSKSVRDCVTMAEGDLPGIWGRGVKEATLTPEEVISEAKLYLSKNPKNSWIAIGQSTERYPEVFKLLPSRRKLALHSIGLHQPQPRILATLVWELIQQGLERNPVELRPRYLRDSEAEVKLKKGLLKVSPMTHRGGIA
jgi:tRNA threonylcarbamoyl adenosine modification protein YeaZ